MADTDGASLLSRFEFAGTRCKVETNFGI